MSVTHHDDKNVSDVEIEPRTRRVRYRAYERRGRAGLTGVVKRHSDIGSYDGTAEDGEDTV